VARPEDLYEWQSEVPSLGHPVLLHALTGFLDAGSAGRIVVDHLLETLEQRVLAVFDTDQLYDYRGRRPAMIFDTDHYEAVDIPQLLLHELRDAAGVPFLLLTGPEPDYRWIAFSDAVRSLIERLDVRLVVSLGAVPWPAPHTRPIGLTAHASNRSLIADHPSWVGALRVPAHVAGLLELRLGAAGHDAMGFVAHVPHYVASLDYPRASVELLDAAASATGLVLPAGTLLEAAATTDAEVDAQVRSTEGNLEAVHALEAQYDAFVASRSGAEGGLIADGPLPTADEIAAQVESFLADLERGDDQR